MPRLREMNADLVGAPRLEATRDEAHAAETLEHLHVGHGVLASSLRGVSAALLVLDAAAEPVTTIFDEVALEARLTGDAVHEREVATLDGVGAELRGKGLLGGPGACEHEEPARVFVDAVDDTEARTPSACTEAIGEECTDAALDRVFVRVVEGNGGDARGLLDHQDLRVGEDDLDRRALGALVRARRIWGYDDLGFRGDLLRPVGPDHPVDGDLASLHELARVAPADTELGLHLPVERSGLLGGGKRGLHGSFAARRGYPRRGPRHDEKVDTLRGTRTLSRHP